MVLILFITVSVDEEWVLNVLDLSLIPLFICLCGILNTKKMIFEYTQMKSGRGPGLGEFRLD